MTTESNEQPMMEIPIEEYELLMASCDAWRVWAGEMHRGLVNTIVLNKPITQWVLDSWFQPAFQPPTDKEGILLKLPGKGKS